MKLIDADKLKAEIERLKSKYRHNGLWLSSTQSMLAGAKIEAMNELLLSLDSLQQEQQEVDLEKVSRNVYESWTGGTMNDVRRDMAELGKVLNTRKED